MKSGASQIKPCGFRIEVAQSVGPGTAGSYPGTAAFTIEQHTIPSVAKLASRHRYPSIVEGNGGGVGGPRHNGRVCHADGVLGIGKPIEHGLRADDEEAPEFVIDANLAATQKRGVCCGPKVLPNVSVALPVLLKPAPRLPPI